MINNISRNKLSSNFDMNVHLIKGKNNNNYQILESFANSPSPNNSLLPNSKKNLMFLLQVFKNK